MTIPEASQLVIKASFIGNYSIFYFDMGEPVKIIDLVKSLYLCIELILNLKLIE